MIRNIGSFEEGGVQADGSASTVSIDRSRSAPRSRRRNRGFRRRDLAHDGRSSGARAKGHRLRRVLAPVRAPRRFRRQSIPVLVAKRRLSQPMAARKLLDLERKYPARATAGMKVPRAIARFQVEPVWSFRLGVRSAMRDISPTTVEMLFYRPPNPALAASGQTGDAAPVPTGEA